MKRIITFLLFLLISGITVAQGTFTCGDPIKDGDDNSYETMQIGDYCWTKTNLRTKTYSNGESIAKAMIYSSGFHPDTNDNVNTFGRLYTWYSAVNLPEGSTATPPLDYYGYVQGICPTNWHIPTPDEMSILNAYSAEELRSTDYWLQPNSNTNSSGFGSLPAGYYNSSINRFDGLLGATGYWTDGNNSNVFTIVAHESPQLASFNLVYHCDIPENNKSDNNYDAMSVRCVRKYCPVPAGDAQSCPGTPIVADHEGNEYETVQIGTQCWTKTNMRCKTSPNGYLKEGKNLANEYIYSYYEPLYYDNADSHIPFEIRGLHYNWSAVVDSTFTTLDTGNYVNRRGICPEGWHVPTTQEWSLLVDYTGNLCSYSCGNNILAVGKALAHKEYWNEYTGDNFKGDCFSGKNPENNNNSGFSAVPAGYFDGTQFRANGTGCDMWTASVRPTLHNYQGEQLPTYAWDRSLTDFNHIGVENQNGERRSFGQTIRCIKNS